MGGFIMVGGTVLLMIIGRMASFRDKVKTESSNLYEDQNTIDDDSAGRENNEDMKTGIGNGGWVLKSLGKIAIITYLSVCVISLIFVMILVWCVCEDKNSTKEMESRVSIIDEPYITTDNCSTEILLDPMFCFSNIQTSWKQNDDYYLMAVCEENGEQVEALFHYQEGSRNIDRTILEISEEDRMEFGVNNPTVCDTRQPYVDDKGCLHMICSGWDGTVYHFWLCIYDTYGSLTQKRDLTAEIHSVVGEYGNAYKTVICPDGNIAFYYYFGSKKRVVMITAEGETVFETPDFHGEIQDIYYTENGGFLCAERKDGAYISVYKIDGKSGKREILIENMPYSFRVNITEGSDMENILFHSDDSMWKVTGRDEVQLVVRYGDLDMLGSKDVFRMSDGSFGLVMKPNGSLRAVDVKEHSWTLVRISSK